jgi:PKD repeat protein
MTQAQTVDWNWAQRIGGISTEEVASMATDQDGNIYITGSYYGPLSFGTYNLTCAGEYDVFVAKMDSCGAWQWAKRAYGTGNENGLGITVDASGSVYVTGSFNSPTLSFATGISLTRNSSSNDIFVAKLNSAGVWQWARKGGGMGTDQGMAVAVDDSSHVYVGGIYTGSATFGSINVAALPNAGDTDIFTGIIDSAGNWLWVAQAGGISPDYANAIALDNQGGIYLAGSYNSPSAVFGNITLNNNYSTGDVFVARLDTQGAWLWALKGGGSGSDCANSMALDPSGNIYITGNKQNSAIFGGTSLPSLGNYDAFAAKLSPQGQWLWAKQAGGSGYDFSRAISADAAGAYLTGYFQNTASFGTTSLTSQGSYDIYMARIDAYGSWQLALSAGAANPDYGTAVALDGSNTIWAGNFTGSIQIGDLTLTSNSDSQDMFFASMSVPGLKLLAPNGGESWISGELHQIEWASSSIDSLHLDYSLDNGINWDPVDTSAVMANVGSYGWMIPNANSAQALIRVRDAANDAVFDISDTTFTITGEVFPPLAGFGSDVTSGYEPLSVQFTDTSLPGSGSITAWNWDFGDGQTSLLQHPQHVYQSEGIYSVGLIVINSYGLSDTLLIPGFIEVLPTWPELNLITPDSLYFANTGVGSASDYQPVTMQNTGTAELIIGDVSLASGLADFEFQLLIREFGIAPSGDATINVRFTPQSDGDILDTLRVVNNSINMPLLEIYLQGMAMPLYDPPQADFTSNLTSGLTPLTVAFEDISIPGSGTIESWQWDYGDGTGAVEQNPVHTYVTAGTFAVTLTVFDSNFLSSSLTRDAYISVEDPLGLIELLSNNEVDFGTVYLTQQSPFEHVLIRNGGNRDVIIDSLYLFPSTADFQSAPPADIALLAPGEIDTLSVRFSPQIAGEQTGQLFISNNSDNTPLLMINLRGLGKIPPPKAPEGLAISRSGGDILLNWTAVSEDILGNPVAVDYYLVFNNGSENLEDGFVFHGLTQQTNYSFPFVTLFEPAMFYRVESYILEDRYGVKGFTAENLKQALKPGMTELEVSRRLSLVHWHD